MKATIILACWSCALLCGCAGVTHRVVVLESPYFTPNNDPNGALTQLVAKTNSAIAERNKKAEAGLIGLRYYRPAPYLLVYSDGKASLKWEIHYLPDPATKASAQPYNIWATLQATLQFNEKGILTGVDETADSQVIPQQIMAAIEKIAPLVAKAFLNAPVAEDTKLNEFPPPRLYKIVVERGRVSLVGGSTDLAVIRSTPKATEQ